MSDETEWVLVPRDATPEMWEAGMNCHSPDDTQGDYLEKAWSAMLAAAPQPPAEAMEAWHSAMNDVGELRANAPDERYAKRAARVESWIKANRPSPPSAPVGVDRECARELLRAEYRKRGIGTDLADDQGTATSVALDAIVAALAQQPAAVDDAMVERAAKELRDLHREFGDGADLPEKIAIEIAEAVLAAALAAQQGGRTDE